MLSVQGNSQGASFHPYNQNRKRLMNIGYLLDQAHTEWYADLHKSWYKYSSLEREGHNIRWLLDEMEKEIEKRGIYERTNLLGFVNELKEKGIFVSMTENCPMIRPDVDDEEDPAWEYNKKAPLKWYDGLPLNVNALESPTEVNILTQGGEGIAGTEPSDGMEVALQGANQVAPFGTFQPSRQVMGIPANRDAAVLAQAQQAGVNLGNYRGDVRTVLQNAGCPENQNCAVYIRNIHPDTRDHEIFDSIWEGGIFQYARQREVQGKYTCHAATLVFKRRQAAVDFLNRVDSGMGPIFRGLRVTCKWNDHRFRPVSSANLHQTRVLQFTGPTDIINADAIRDVLSKTLQFNLIQKREWLQLNGYEKVVELAFASIRGQSRLAIVAFRDYLQTMSIAERRLFHVAYAADPCGN